MKIIFVSSFPPERDGIASYTARLVHALSKKHDVMVIAKPCTGAQEDFPTTFRVQRSLALGVRHIRDTYRTISSEKPDVLHVQYTIPLFGLYSLALWLVVGLVKQAASTKIVVTFHEVKREADKLGMLGRFHFRIISMLVDRVVVHTHEAEGILVSRCHVPDEKILVMPHGTYDLPSTAITERDVRDELSISRDRVILSFGFIHIDKGIEYLIDAFSELLSQHKFLLENTQLLIVGSVRPRSGVFKYFGALDEKYYHMLKDRVNKSSVKDNITMCPSVPDEYIGPLFRMATVAVLPYTNAEQSGVLNIALSTQTPMVASDIGGIGETLADVGVLVPPRDSSAIAASLMSLIEDKKYARSIADKYAVLHSRLQPRHIAALLEEEYQKLASQ